MNALVAFFSASGITAKVAQNLAQATDSPIYEIKPKQPYTAADLDWRDKTSRSSVEMSDPSSRPPLTDSDADVAGADVLFIGFPIWWYREPSVIDTFLESYDFKDKTIVPFATSGSSDIGETSKRIQQIAGKKTTVLEGKRFASAVSVDELKKWLRTLGI